MDIGCAYGLLVNAASKCFESYGIDISQFAIMKSKKYCKGNIFPASAPELPFRNDTFDVITILDTLEHVAHLNKCLRDVVRILKQNGILLLQLPNPLIWTHFCGRLGLQDETHANNFMLKRWKSICKSAPAAEICLLKWNQW